MRVKVRTIAYLGMFIALVVLSTVFLKLPIAIGYVNLGDGFILAAATLLGPLAALPGAIGSMLADLFLGYAIYAPASFVIKGLMGLIAGLLPRLLKSKRAIIQGLGFLLAELFMVLGYFIFESFLYGAGTAALSILPNLAQGAFGFFIGLALLPLMNRVSIQ